MAVTVAVGVGVLVGVFDGVGVNVEVAVGVGAPRNPVSNVWLFDPGVPVVRLMTGNVPAGDPDGLVTFAASESDESSSPN